MLCNADLSTGNDPRIGPILRKCSEESRRLFKRWAGFQRGALGCGKLG